MEELIEKAKHNDKEAFTELMLQIEKDLYIISKMKLNIEDACDAIQETMIATYEQLHKLKENKYFKTWVVRILINKCNRMKRSKYKNILTFENNDIENTVVTEDKNDKLDFEIVISTLTEKEQTIMTLYYYLGYTTLEISKILKIKEGTIRSKISRAKQKIKEQYKGEWR